MEKFLDHQYTYDDQIDDLILSIHIGGAHITAALYSIKNRALILDSYHRAPLSHKADADLITRIWKSTIAKVIQNIPSSLFGCSIALPVALNQTSEQELAQNYRTYAALRQLDVADFFSQTLKLPMDKINLVTSAEALLKGEFDNCGYLPQKSLMISIGTDFNAAERSDQMIKKLNWECISFKSGIANEILSTQSLTERYARMTGISVINTEQLFRLYRDNPNAKLVFKQYISDLMEFLRSQVSISDYHQIFIEGDIALATQQIKNMINNQPHSANFYFLKPNKLTLLAGGALLGMERTMLEYH